MIKGILEYVRACLMAVPNMHDKPGYCRAPVCPAPADALGYCALHRERGWPGA